MESGLSPLIHQLAPVIEDTNEKEESRAEA
jgi:hypothetical protein